MSTPSCFECGQPADHAHHVVPRSSGGAKTVPLCHLCHGKAHHTRISSPVLIRAGLERARARGARLGRHCVSLDVEAKVRALRKTGKGIRGIARELGIGNCTVSRIVSKA